ncbi:MAG: 50S ribosomal protein L3 [Deltaproteobacteria bacterium]|nr:MAG: 50S ribosomal protein L3 [Deltaproteobacteria bacterium]
MANEKMGLLGRKLGMTQIYSDEGIIKPCTVVQVGPNTVTQVKTADGKDGYNALQLGFGEQKAQRLTKAELGHTKKAGIENGVRYLREIRVSGDAVGNYEPGQTLNAADVFEVGQSADVIGTSKGKGFAGVMKRHNFQGFIRSHGTHEFFRHGGSIGCRLTPGRVMKGKKMGGHMGAVRVTVQNLEIAKIDAERNLVYLVGGVPGANGGLVTIRQAVKG